MVAIDVVGADHSTREVLRWKVQLDGGLELL
jgi:hypothetical protein